MSGDDVSEERSEERPERFNRPSRARFRVFDRGSALFLGAVDRRLRRLFEVTLERRMRFA